MPVINRQTWTVFKWTQKSTFSVISVATQCEQQIEFPKGLFIPSDRINVDAQKAYTDLYHYHSHRASTSCYGPHAPSLRTTYNPITPYEHPCTVQWSPMYHGQCSHAPTPDRMTDRHDWKHYIPAIPLTCGNNKLHIGMIALLRLPMLTSCRWWPQKSSSSSLRN